ncbi:uncharacterized protein [Anoplolepis gracilipes]|uniref:uncharacterized protein n=1 Tax=Anoplolepis gracilipes TaxID=354296 RepID=UPI003B9E30AF
MDITMQKMWIISFMILILAIANMKSTKDIDTKNSTVVCKYNVELSTEHNTKNITELNTIQTMTLNSTNIKYDNSTNIKYDNNSNILKHENSFLYVSLKKYICMQIKYRKIKVCVPIVIVLLINIAFILIILAIEYNYIRINSPCHVIRKCYQSMRRHRYIVTENDIEIGSIWDARHAYNNMLARRREQEAMRMILYYDATPEFDYNSNTDFVRQPQRQTV